MESNEPIQVKETEKRSRIQVKEAEKRSRITDDQFLEFVTLRVTNAVDEKSRHRGTRRLAILSTLIGIIGVAGTGIVAWVSSLVIQASVETMASKMTEKVISQVLEKLAPNLSNIKGEIRRDSEAEFEQKIEKSRREFNGKAAELEKELVVQSFYITSRAIDIGDSFSKADRDQVMSILRQVAPDPKIRSRPEFLVTVGTLITAFRSADLDIELDEIDDMLSSTLSESNSIVSTYLEHYGRQCVFKPANSNLESRFKRYVRAAHRFKMFGAESFWMLLHEYQNNGSTRSKATERILVNVSTLGEAHRREFFRLVDRYQNPAKWLEPVTGWALTVKQVLSDIEAAHPDIRKTQSGRQM